MVQPGTAMAMRVKAGVEAPVFLRSSGQVGGQGCQTFQNHKGNAMRLTLSFCLALSLVGCGKYENEPVLPATRQQTVFTYGDRPMTAIWSEQTNAIVPCTNSKVLLNRDVTGIVTIRPGSPEAAYLGFIEHIAMRCWQHWLSKSLTG